MATHVHPRQLAFVLPHEESLTRDNFLEGPANAAALALVEARDLARTERRFADADELRGRLVELGYTVEDSAQGTVIRRKQEP